eukprot:12909603-Prorocentrum_lima.AAC.1
MVLVRQGARFEPPPNRSSADGRLAHKHLDNVDATHPTRPPLPRRVVGVSHVNLTLRLLGDQ